MEWRVARGERQAPQLTFFLLCAFAICLPCWSVPISRLWMEYPLTTRLPTYRSRPSSKVCRLSLSHYRSEHSITTILEQRNNENLHHPSDNRPFARRIGHHGIPRPSVVLSSNAQECSRQCCCRRRTWPGPSSTVLEGDWCRLWSSRRCRRIGGCCLFVDELVGRHWTRGGMRTSSTNRQHIRIAEPIPHCPEDSQG